MRIGLVLPAVPGYSETFFVNKIRGLHSQGHEVVLFVSGSPIVKTFESAVVVTAPKLSGNLLLLFFRESYSFLLLLLLNFTAVQQFYHLERNEKTSLFSILKKIAFNRHLLSAKVDWLHFGFGTMALGRENVAQAINAKMAVSFRGFDYYVYPIKNPYCYSKLFSKIVRYHVLSESMKKGLIQKGVSEDAIFKIMPAIATDQFTETKMLEFKNELKIVTIARLHWIKGLEYTLEALALLKKKGIIFHYTIVGDGSEKERLLFAAHQLGLTDRVTFTGKLESSTVRQMLKEATLYVQYSIQEGFCNAVLEAQAIGKLCIVSDAEGLAENVIDGVTGFVVAKRNPVFLANMIVEVFHLSENKKNKISNTAVERVRADFSIEKQIKEFIDFYEKESKKNN